MLMAPLVISGHAKEARLSLVTPLRHGGLVARAYGPDIVITVTSPVFVAWAARRPSSVTTRPL